MNGASLRRDQGQTAGACPVLFFDGQCGLCNRLVRLLLRLDRREILSFAPLQGPSAQAYLRKHGLPTEDFDSLVFVPDWGRRDQPGYLLRTEGALAALGQCGGFGYLTRMMRAVPQAWRDRAYKGIARTRYRLFGEWVPRPLPRREWRRRFLDSAPAD